MDRIDEAGHSWPEVKSRFLHARASVHGPALDYLCMDSLGKGCTHINLLKTFTPRSPWRAYPSDSFIEYRHIKADTDEKPAWSFAFSERCITMTTAYSGTCPPEPLAIEFDRPQSSATVLGRFSPETLRRAPMHASVLRDGLPRAGAEMCFPCVLHLPDRGSFRLHATAPVTLSFFADRKRDGTGYTRIVFPAATSEHPRIEYTWEVVALYPDVGIPDEAIYDGFRRNFLNALQLNPTICMLANSSAGGPSPFALYFYSAVAAQGVELFEGFTTLDLLRQTLDRFVHGFMCYGMAGYAPENPSDFMDAFPSLCIAVGDYVLNSGDREWLKLHYDTLRGWAHRICAHDLDEDGLVEYVLSGNSGSWPEIVKDRPANWWDCIGFGHKDAYGNVLAYRALRRMGEMARMAGHARDAEHFSIRADTLKSLFVPTFLHPATGVLAGWKSADGELHDYWFLFLNSLAIEYGLVPDDLAHAIMDRLLAKLEEVGYDRFDLGLPGNLVSVARKDYVHRDPRWGGGQREDNADGFQKYENGGATACFAGHTVEALYRLGRWGDGDRIFGPLLRSFEAGAFQGRGPSGMTKDWKTWDGTCYGYEGLLADGYKSLLPVLTRIRHPEPIRA